MDKVPLQVFDTHHREHELQVTRSLLDAIRRLCSSRGGAEFFLWVDQLSIDQSSVTEKNVQIAMMKEIYEHAKNVVVWLGPAQDDSDIAFRKIKEVGHIWNDIQPCEGEPLDIHILLSKVLNHVGRIWSDTPDSRLQWNAIKVLFDRPWWLRTWIRAEATAVARKATPFLCGPSFMTMEVLNDFLDVMMLLMAAKPALCGDLVSRTLSRPVQISDFYAMRRQTQSAPALLPLVRKFRHSKSTDPGDKIFCLVAFASDASEPGVQFDIEYGHDTKVVFANFAIWTMRRYKTIEIFSDCHSSLGGEGLSSWMPAWSVPPSYSTPLDGDSFKQGPRYSASGKWADTLAVGPYRAVSPPRMLLLSGVCIATVASVSEASPALSSDLNMAKSWLSLEDREAICPLNKISNGYVLARTVSTNQGDMVDLWGEELKNVMDRLTPLSVVRNRRLFFTTPGAHGGRGVIGLGPGYMIPGDSIFMVKGGRLLYVLQELTVPTTRTKGCLDLTGGSETSVTLFAEKDTVYVLAGECFIYGLMNGELLDYLGEPPKKERPAVLEAMDKDFRRIILF